MPSIEPIVNFLNSLGSGWWIPLAIAAAIAFGLTAALGVIYRKADQPFIAAFIPVWNLHIFYKLGGYSAIWTIIFVASVIVPLFAGYNTVANVTSLDGVSPEEFGVSLGALGFLTSLSGLGIFVSGIVLFLSAYNIGRAFNKDALMAIVFLVANPIWLIAIAATKYDWDEPSAHPNSIGRMPDYRVARSRYKNHKKAVKKRKKGKGDDEDFMIIDSGSASADYDGKNWLNEP